MSKAGRQKRPQSRKQRQRYGVMVGAVSIVLAAGFLLASLFNTQILQHDVYAREAADQHYRRVVDYPQRGNILDSEGNPLAVSDYVYNIGITPKDVASTPKSAYPLEQISAELARILSMNQVEIDAALAQIDRVYVKLKDKVERETYDELVTFIREGRIGGIAIDPVQIRRYPQGDVAAALVGFTNAGAGIQQGVNGLESYYDSILAGAPGYTYAEVDNYSNQALPYSDPTVQPAEDGHSLKLYLNAELNKIAQEELDKAVGLFNLEDGGIAILMDPKTGGVLAMAQSGSYDLNEPFSQPIDWHGADEWNPRQDEADLDYLTGHTWMNRSVSLTYEPGSINKALTAAAAIDSGTVNLAHEYSDAPIWVEGWNEYAITCANPQHHGTRTLEEALWTSCNPVLVQVGQSLGMERFYDYVRAFGHLTPTGIDLPAETSGLNHDKNPLPIDLATWSFGEQATVTPIQMINSYLPFGNGGLLMRPQVVKSIMGADGQVIQTIEPEVVRRVLSEETADLMLHYLRGVVYNGGGHYGAIPGYHVAGKTATSTSGENEQDSVVSFASLAPGNDPQLVVLVSLFNPRPKVPSRAAQSVNREISERALEYLGIAPQYTDYDYEKLWKGTTVRNLVGLPIREARQQAYYYGFTLDVPEGVHENALVTGQYPAAWTHSNQVEGVAVSTTSAQVLTNYVTVPDLTGLLLEEALAEASKAGINLTVYGDNPRGRSTQQSIQPGTADSLRRHGTLVLAFAGSSGE